MLNLTVRADDRTFAIGRHLVRRHTECGECARRKFARDFCTKGFKLGQFAADLAREASTIPWEIFTRIAPRIPRFYS